MTEGNQKSEEGPKVSLQQISLARGDSHGTWLIAWKVENLDQRPIRLTAARFPHSQFKAGEQQFRPNFILGGKKAAQFETSVLCAAPAGVIVENAFIILSVVWLERHWRIFVRLRILVDDQGKPTAVTASITSQQVGFSTDLRSED